MVYMSLEFRQLFNFPIWTPQYGPPLWTPNMDPQYGPPFWTLNIKYSKNDKCAQKWLFSLILGNSSHL
jgi:hypothetical protein